MTSFEDRVREMTVPRNGTYPRPWMTDHDPTRVDVLIVGASSAKTFHVADVGDHDQFLDALWNRNDRTCRGMYEAATAKPSPTRPNLDRLSKMLAERDLTSLQTNVTCASARYDDEVSDEDRAHGAELFKVVVEHTPWRAMIVYGVGACDRFGRTFGIAMPPVPSAASQPVSTALRGRPVFVSPTLAPPGYRGTVWPYLERVVATIAEGGQSASAPAAQTAASSSTRSAPMLRPREDVSPSHVPGPPAAFNSSEANRLVWRRMHELAATSALEVNTSTQQAALVGAPEHSSTDRVFRHKFRGPTPDLLVREDVFCFDSSLCRTPEWREHTNPAFRRIQTGDPKYLERIMDAIEAFAAERAP